MSADEICALCGARLEVSTVAETLRNCANCGSELVAQQARAVTLLTRGGDAEPPRKRGLIALTPEFRTRYRLLRVAGTGAVGTVVEAEDLTASGRRVAVKFLTKHASAVVQERWVREVRALASLTHPRVVRMIEAGELDGHPYVVTAYLPGGTLRRQITKRGAHPFADAIAVAVDVLEGLTACHAAGIVHRDVKPENVLFDADGRACLADLGLAKEEGGASLTAEGVAVGTPLYMAPEQITASPVSPASDVYATGLMLYEMLAGKHPFAGYSLGQILDHHLRTVPAPLHERCADATPATSAVLARAVAKDPEQRYATAKEMADALLALAPRGAAKPAPPASKPAPPASKPAAPARAPAPARPPSSPSVPTPRGLRRPAPPRSATGAPPAASPPRHSARVRAAGAAGAALVVALSAYLVRPIAPPPAPVASAIATKLPAFLLPPKPSPPHAPADAGGGGGARTSGAPPSLEDPDDMALVPASRFTMGGQESIVTDAKAHPVELRAFWIDRHEVTNARFARFVKAAHYVTDAERRGRALVHDGRELAEVAGADWRHPRGADDSIDGHDDLPVVQVTWNDAFAFSVWAKKRLPTEAEWEHAARAPGAARFPWGDDPPAGRACFARSGADGPMPIGSFSANAFELCDMIGNVREWCGDWYGAGYYGSSPEADPPGPDSGRAKVVRGGGFLAHEDELSVTARRQAIPSTAAMDLGFRTARDARR